ncbi:MAG: EVE domain-containing protein [Alphaproteobacteria bacterium]|nr:EVE domain-containing protein [Alphaproteobacteria bacterium]
MLWLVKTEPGNWSWQDQVREKTTKWDGVRNYQARNNMKAMKLGDRCFLYHSATKEPAIMGIVTVIKLYESEPDEPTFGYVTVECVAPLDHPVTLRRIKEDPHLSELALVKQSRLSVMPISEEAWDIIIGMSKNA